jgi:hypothetical protein
MRRLVAHRIADEVLARFGWGEVAARDLARWLAPGGGVELPKQGRVGVRFDPSQACRLVQALNACGVSVEDPAITASLERQHDHRAAHEPARQVD